MTRRYHFTQSDANDIAAMGYLFKGVMLAKFSSFMLRYFPGFDLKRLLQVVEKIMVPHTSAKILREIMVSGTELHVRLENDHKGLENDALIFHRKFINNKNVIKIRHEFLVFPLTARNKGFSKTLLKECLVEYQQMNAKVIELTAGLSAGAYVWARAGFVATDRGEIYNILKSAKSKLTTRQYDLVNKIFDNYYNKTPKGRSFPIRQWADLPFMKSFLVKMQWSGRLNLKNREHLRKFEQYVSA